MQTLAHRFHINIFYRNYIVLVCDPAAQFMQIISSLAAYFFMTSGNFLFLPHIIVAPFYTSWQFTLFPCQPFFIFSEESCFFHLNLFWKHCHPLHRIINPKYFGVAVILICCLVFAAVSFIQQTCKILSGRLHTYCHWFQTAVFCRLPVFFHGYPF